VYFELSFAKGWDFRYQSKNRRGMKKEKREEKEDNKLLGILV